MPDPQPGSVVNGDQFGDWQVLFCIPGKRWLIYVKAYPQLHVGSLTTRGLYRPGDLGRTGWHVSALYDASRRTCGKWPGRHGLRRFDQSWRPVPSAGIVEQRGSHCGFQKFVKGFGARPRSQPTT